jgi:hypothetical protein
MNAQRLLPVAMLSLSLAACATTGDGSANAVTTSNPVAGNAATSAAGAKAIGAYGAIGTSDDVRGRSGSSGASTLTGRANLGGSDSGTSDQSNETKPPPR